MKLTVLKYLDLGVEYSVYGVIFFTPLSIARVGIFAGIAVVLFLIKQILSPNFSSIRSNKTFFLLLLIFFFFMALSLFNSGPLILKSLKALVLKWGRFPLILWMVLDTFQDTKRILKATGVIVFTSMMIGLSVFSQKFFGWEFFRHMQIRGHGDVTGPFPNQNQLAAYLTCVIPIVLSYGLWKWKRIWSKLGFILITTMLILSSWWTLCRGGWVGLTAGLVSVAILVKYNRLPKKKFWTLLIVGNIFGLLSILIAILFYKHTTDRFILIHAAWRMIVEHPFLGKGLGTFMDYCALYSNNYGIYYAHNCFFQIWAESGIFSLLSFLVFNGYVFYKNIQVIRGTPASLLSYILIGLNAGLLGFLVHSFFDTHFYSFQLSFLFWTVLGLTMALSCNLEERLVTQENAMRRGE